jgi:hypothetical protein
MSITDNAVGDAAPAEASAVEEFRPPLPSALRATARFDAATGALTPESTARSVDPRKPRPASAWIADLPFVVFLAFILLSVLALVVAWANDPTREFLDGHKHWILPGYGLLFTAVVTAILAWWSRSRGTAVRVAVLILVGFPALLIALAGVLLLLDPVWQVNAVRTVVSLLLFLTPAVMWWLFLAAQQASLLNEFLANLQRLGLLEARHWLGETVEARATRIDSYLQKFEGTYGRVPHTIHDDVIGQHFQPYSQEEARAQAPVSVAAVPVSISVAVLAIGWLLTLPPVNHVPADDRPIWADALAPLATPVTFAFLGAYFFSIQMLFRRYVRSDLRGSAYVAVVMRIVLAVISIWVLQGIAELPFWTVTHHQLLLLGFSVGVFPVVVWQIIRSLMIKIFKFTLPSLQSQLALDGLDGLTVWHESRLEEEDIENIPNMATADIVGLLVSTRFPADRIVDWVDQAILLTYLGSDQATDSECPSARRTLERHGVRTASALLSTANAMAARGDFDTFAALIADQSGRPAIPSLLSSIRTNNNLALVLRWRGMKDGPGPVPGPGSTPR